MKTMNRILAVLLSVMLIAVLAVGAAADTATVQTEEQNWLDGWFIHNGVRNNFHSFIGIVVKVGPADIHVTEIGRMFYAGNSQEHILKIVDAETKADVASVTVNMAGGTVDQFTYGKLDTPVTLKAGKSYYLVSEEHYDGDAFAEHGFRYDATRGLEATGGVFYLPEGDSWNPDTAGTYGFVGFDLKFTMDKKVPSGNVQELVGEKQINEILRNNFDTRIGTAFTVGNKDIYVTELGRLFWNGNSQTHYLAVVDAETGKDVLNTGVTVPATGTHGQYTWAALANPVKLTAGKTYYIVSSETNGGDQWLEGGSVFTGTADVTLVGSAYWLGDHYDMAAGTYFNGTSLKYTLAVEDYVEPTEPPATEPPATEPAATDPAVTEPGEPANPKTGDMVILPLVLMFGAAGAALSLKRKSN